MAEEAPAVPPKKPRKRPPTRFRTDIPPSSKVVGQRSQFPVVEGRKATGIPLPANWKDKYLAHLERWGTYAKAAKVAGVSSETIRRYRHTDAEFDAACREAREIHADSMEELLQDIGETDRNVVGPIVRLKAIRPDQYIEKHAVMSLHTHVVATEEEAQALIERMFQRASPEALAMLRPPEGADAG